MNLENLGFGLRQSLAEVFNVEFDDIDGVIAKLKSESLGYRGLADLENKYLIEASERFGVERSWQSVTSYYHKWIDLNITRMKSQNEIAKAWIRREFLRFTLAKFLQLNKFTASLDEIQAELSRYGIKLNNFFNLMES